MKKVYYKKRKIAEIFPNKIILFCIICGNTPCQITWNDFSFCKEHLEYITNLVKHFNL